MVGPVDLYLPDFQKVGVVLVFFSVVSVLCLSDLVFEISLSSGLIFSL